MRDKIIGMLGKRGDLPPFPEILKSLQEKLKDPDVHYKDLAKIIELDSSLAGNTLKIANSAFYNPSGQKISNLSVAITKLGLQKIKNLIFSLELTKLFKNSQIINYYDYWRHSLSVAYFSQLLSKYTQVNVDIKDAAYLAGLIHDTGIMVFTVLIPDEYNDFLSILSEKDEPLEQQEQSVFGIDHQELGAIFIEKWWNIDAGVVDAVKYHHKPFREIGVKAERKCLEMVNVSNGICNTLGYTNGIVCYTACFDDGAWEQLGLSLADVDNMTQDVNESMKQAEEILGYQKQG